MNSFGVGRFFRPRARGADWSQVVRVHRTGKAGVVPAFNIEGQFEKEARHNKEANEKVRVSTSLIPAVY